VIVGGAPGAPRATIRDSAVWTASDVDDRVARITTLAADLDNLRVAVLSLAAPPFVSALGAPITLGGLQALAANIDATAREIRLELASLVAVQRILAARQAHIADMSAELTVAARSSTVLLATSVGDFSTRHSWYLSADLGLGVAPVINEVFPYAGMNIYFRPVNKAAPLQEFGSFAKSFTRRASLLVGVTVAANLAKAGEREALIGSNQTLLAGGGVRVTDSIRVAGGVLLFRALDPNPLIDHTKLQVTPFFSVSVDWDVKGTFSGLAGNAPAGQ